MYIPASKLSKDQEIVCLYTDEAYVYVEDHEKSTLTPDQLSEAIEVLPERFFKHPKVLRGPNGEIKVYGIRH